MTFERFNLLAATHSMTGPVELAMQDAIHKLDPNMEFVLMDIPNDATATFAWTFTDQFNRPMPAETGGSVATSDGTIATAAMSADGSHVTITPVATSGTFSMTYTSASGVVTTFPFNIVAITPVVGLDIADVVYAAK